MELEKLRNETNKIHNHVEIISPAVKCVESCFILVSTLIAFQMTYAFPILNNEAVKMAETSLA